ncbi:VOC family protein [Paenibacillus sp. GSMTC-2017]|uniref:VOC family protein n=1 Tax=Paenibacillus sp. GSMTC-2017 TaxID=2794350 RepID=UPI0018D9C639|nr:VOC family protein [Paenibacillus sp. GSMTC-2017]MBH5318303.1 VOC family protein [Paenibacillus sp. GSMTC-2017]
MSRVVHFEIEAKDPEKKMAFYKDVFGWEFQEMMEGYWSVITGPAEDEGIDGGIMKAASEDAVRTINTIKVENLDEYLGKVEQAGGKVTSEKMDIPEVGVFAYCEDIDGLSFGVIEFTAIA